MGYTKRTGRQASRSSANTSTGKTCPVCRQRNCTPRHMRAHMKAKAYIKTLRLIGLGYVEQVRRKSTTIVIYKTGTPYRGHQHLARTIL